MFLIVQQGDDLVISKKQNNNWFIQCGSNSQKLFLYAFICFIIMNERKNEKSILFTYIVVKELLEYCLYS